MNKKLVASFKTGVPYLLLGIGLILLIVGETINLVDHKKDLWIFSLTTLQAIISGLGKVIIISGITTITLDSFKYLGIFKSELFDIIFGSDFLSTRKDLPQIWERVTKALFKDKFPKINNLILADVKDIYLPTASVKYYDNFWQHLNIKLLDAKTEKVEVIHTTKFTLIPSTSGQVHEHHFRNKINTNGDSKSGTYEIKTLKINNIDSPFDVKTEHRDNVLRSDCIIKLEGAESYYVEMIVRKTYCLKYDNIIGQGNSYFINNFVVQFQLNNVRLEFFEVGTIKPFETNTSNPGLLIKEYSGLLYPKQGYLAVLRKK